MDTVQTKYDVAAYVWPAYSICEPRAKLFWPEGYGEWQTVKAAWAKFTGHTWPRRPLWGYTNEADPYVMEMEIAAAADHGVNTFIYDWYWYDGAPFLESCLNDGFLKAKNNARMRFYLMWANHSVNFLWDKRSSWDLATTIWDGAVDRRQFEIVGHRLIAQCFHHPCYYRIDGKPVFMIYDVANLLRGLGGISAARSALDWLRTECVKSGLPGLHLQLVMWSERRRFRAEGGENGPADKTPADIISALGFDSMTHYQYVHFTNVNRNYADILPDVTAEWERISTIYDIPYYAHVSVGWDSSPRFNELRPGSGIVKDAKPIEIAKALTAAKAYVDARPANVPLITINSWNEWTETSYLQPDDLYGYGYLDAVKRVFGSHT